MKDNERVLASCCQVVLGIAQVTVPVNKLSGPHEIICVLMSSEGSSLREATGLPFDQAFHSYLPLLALSMRVASSLPLLL